MNQNETQWDKLLKIKTIGRDDSRSDQYRVEEFHLKWPVQRNMLVA